MFLEALWGNWSGMLASLSGTNRYCEGSRAPFGRLRAVRTDFAVTLGLLFEQIRAVRTGFAVTIEGIVANQGGMDFCCGGIWPLFGQIKGVRTEFAVTLERLVPNQGGMDIFGAVCSENEAHI